MNSVRLLGLLMEDGVMERLALVEDGEVFVEIHTDGDRGLAHGISGALGLDLIDDLIELNGEVFGEDACLLPGQDMSEVILVGERTMPIKGTSGLDSKAPVEVIQE